MTTLVTEQQSIKVFAVGASGTAQRTVLEFPKDAKSNPDGSAQCGNISLTFLDQSDNVLDL
jgi:hypothetical protein